MTLSLQLLVSGPLSDPGADDYFDDAGTITVSRGIRFDGVLDRLEPGELTATLQGAGYFPDVNTHVRAGRQTVLRLADSAGPDYDIFTGRNDDLDLHPAKRTNVEPWVLLSALDLVAGLSKVKGFSSTGGSLTQRVDAALDATDSTAVPYTVHDPDAPGATPALTTDAKSAIEQLRLVLDTAHAIAYVDGEGQLQIYADSLRPAGPAVLTLTDGTAPGDADYIDLDRDASSKDVLNHLTLTRLDTDETLTVHDRTSSSTYGLHHQDVTVLDGSLEDHGWRLLSLRWPPVDTIRSVTINATLSDVWLEAAQLNPYDVVDVVTDGTTVSSRVLYLEHTITPRKGQAPKWMVTLTLARLDLVPLSWDQVPSSITWDDVPDTVTWNSVATWHPELD